MAATEVVKGRWYPMSAPALPGETPETWTDRVLGFQGKELIPYDHRRNRQCSIGYHDECSDPNGISCECPCHKWRVNAEYHVDQWNEKVPVGTVVSFVKGSVEPPVATTSAAWVDGEWPMVELDTFPRPVELSWLVAP
jgi:hypothetical protein